MADKSKFKFAAFLSMGLLFSIYFPTAASGYLSLGDCVEENVINGLSDGALKKADHLISIRMTMIVVTSESQKTLPSAVVYYYCAGKVFYDSDVMYYSVIVGLFWIINLQLSDLHYRS
jgi:hypothetical protein